MPYIVDKCYVSLLYRCTAWILISIQYQNIASISVPGRIAPEGTLYKALRVIGIPKVTGMLIAVIRPSYPMVLYDRTHVRRIAMFSTLVHTSRLLAFFIS